MNSDRWRRVEEVYDVVLAQPPEQRPGVLEELCAADADLRREVESLLAARDRAGDFLSPDNLLGHIATLTADSELPALGSRLGDYEILAAIGAGAMGEVYRARDTRLDREVALKVLPALVVHDPGRIARFRLEAKAASALNHPNIVTIYEIGRAGGTWYIAAELIEGVTLRQRIAGGRMGREEAIGIGLQCAAALGAAHRAGVVHRDIKPENIMLRPDGVVKIVDFGLARIVDAHPEWNLDVTQTGTVMGTPRYMSPEQARGEKSDARSDIFSLAAVLFELATGRPAFPGRTTAEVFSALLNQEPDMADAGALGGVISKAIAKEPAGRYETMEEFANGLRSFDPSDAAPLRARRPGAPGGGRFQVRAPRAALLTVSLAVLAVAAYAWISARVPRPGAPNLVPLTTSGGPKFSLGLAPDGSRIAFSAGLSGNARRHIYVKAAGQGEPVQLTSAPESDVLPAWSPDGNWIAFCRRSSNDNVYVPHGIYIIPANGGPERKVAEAWKGVSWSTDGKTVALAHLPKRAIGPGPESGGIFLLSLESGQRREVTASHRDSVPAYSPNGKWIAFTREISETASEIFVVRPEGGAAKQLTFDRQAIRGFTWTADSGEVVFASSRSGADGSLWRIPVTGGAPRPISATLRDATEPNISRRGDRLAYREDWIDTNIYLRAGQVLPGAVPGRFSEPVVLVNSSRADHSPAFSPDGERMAFVSNRTGNEEIWVSRRDGSQAVPLTSLRAANTGTPRWSPDGRQIAFDSWAPGVSAIYVVDSGGGVPRVLSATPSGSWMPSWSPDGKWIYFSSGLSGARQIWKMPASRGQPTQLTHTGAFEAQPSPDGRLVYYSKQSPAGGYSIWSIPAAGGPEERLSELERFHGITRCWGVLEQGIYFMSNEDSPRQMVRFLSFQTHRVTDLFQSDKQLLWGVGALAFSRDGRYALTVQMDHAVSDLMMIENFR